jgi:hypothetical protein
VGSPPLGFETAAPRVPPVRRRDARERHVAGDRDAPAAPSLIGQTRLVGK